ncbi:MAG: ABC transporter ATP-binding protein [Bacteroidetes bacterium]|nr:ABC transporter ATP-binding protein [Bacteroidota bacterium]
MLIEKNIKQDVWKNIYRLIAPQKKTFFSVVFLGLLSTGVTLIEPLIYREAVNDIAGLFVKQAKDDVRNELGVAVDEEDPLTSLFQSKEDSPKATKQTSHSKHKHKAKEPHTATHVASRTPQQALKTLLWAVALLFLINLVYYIVWLWGEYINVKFACRAEQSFIQNTFYHVLRLPLNFFTKRSSTAISKQIDQTEEVASIVNGFSQTILPELISLVGILAIMFWQNITLSWLAVSVIPLYVIIALRSVKGIDEGLSVYYEKWEEVYARMQDAVSGIKTVKLSGAETREVNNFQSLTNQAYAEYIQRTNRNNKYTFLEGILTHVAKALVLGYGGYLTLQHKLTPGDVVMFVAYLDMLYDPIDNLTELWTEMQRNIVSIARAFKLLDNNVEEKQGATLKITDGKIEFDKVHFGYTPEREILKGLSFTIHTGNLTAIVGTSGAGKTTTVDLLLKLFEPNSGEILIDGQKLSQADASSVRAQIGMVNADGSIFRGTLAYNIRYKRPDATDDEVMQAALAAGMQSTLQRLPDGLNTLVGDSGFGLSVGERQRIQIARVLIAKSKILILDEVTANLDYKTEAEVKHTVDEIRKQNTVIVIAHRFSMVKDADHVIVLDDGNILEEGKPADLIANAGWFADFANAVEDDGVIEDEIIEEEIQDEDSET